MTQHAQGDPEVLQQLGAGNSRSIRRWLYPAFAGILLLLAVASILAWRKKTAEAGAPQWITQKIEAGDLRETIAATGTLDALDAVEVGAEVSGRVMKVTVDINDPVTKGQVLVELDTESLQAQLEQSRAQLMNAQASVATAKATLREAELKAARARELHKQGLISVEDLETSEATLDRARASVTSASAQVTVAQAGVKSSSTGYAKALVKSPIDGIVLARSVEPGQTVAAGFQTPVLLTLARDITQMELKVSVDEADVGKVRDGQPATFVVDAYPSRKFASKVVRLNNLPKSGTSVVTYETLLTVDNSERLLRPGMTATATIVTSEKTNVLLVPNASLRFSPDDPSAGTKRSSAGGLPVPGLGPPPGMGQAAQKTAGTTAVEAGTEGTVYLVQSSQLAKILVRRGTTDGKRTEVISPELMAGMDVVVDVTETVQ